METKRKTPVLIAVCCLSLYLLHSLTAGYNAATTMLMEAYPDAALSTISLVASLAMFAAFPGNLVSGIFVNSIGFKKTIYFALTLTLIAGLIPFFFELSLGMLIATRAVVGFCYGLLMPMGATAVSAFFEGSKRSTILGFGQGVSGFGGLLMSVLAGILLSISLRHVALYHLFVLVPFVLVIIMPNLPREEVNDAPKAKADYKFSGTTWFFCLIQAFAILFYYPTNIYLSNIAVAEGFGTVAQVAVALSCITIGAAASGFIYSFTKKLFGKRIIGVCMMVMAAGMAAVAFGHSMALIYVAYALIGLFYMSFVICCTDNISRSAKPTQITTAVGIGFAVSTAGCLVSVYVLDFISKVFGKAEDVRFYFVISMVALAAFGIYSLIRPKNVAESNDNQASI